MYSLHVICTRFFPLWTPYTFASWLSIRVACFDLNSLHFFFFYLFEFHCFGFETEMCVCVHENMAVSLQNAHSFHKYYNEGNENMSFLEFAKELIANNQQFDIKWNSSVFTSIRKIGTISWLVTMNSSSMWKEKQGIFFFFSLNWWKVSQANKFGIHIPCSSYTFSGTVMKERKKQMKREKKKNRTEITKKLRSNSPKYEIHLCIKWWWMYACKCYIDSRLMVLTI